MAEEKIIRVDGSEVDVEIKAFPIVYDKKPAIQIIVHDITERKKAKEELRWNPKFNELHTIIKTAWNWHKNNPNGYCE